jgi:outer membrane protein assembly factor BamB
LWKNKIGGPNRFQGTPQENPSSPLIIEDTLYVGSSTGIFYAYSLKKGKRLWTFDAQSAIHASVANEGSICFGTAEGVLYCLNRASGEELFHYNITSSISSAPVMDSERIYILSTKNRLHAIDLNDGKKHWTYSQRYREGLSPRFINTPAQSGDQLFVLFTNGVLVAIKKDNGKELWQRSVLKGEGPWPGARKRPLYLNGNLYIIDQDGALLVLDANNGSLHMVFDVAKAVDFIVTRDNIIIASIEELISINRESGNALWIEALDAASSNRIFGAGEHIYIVSVKEKDPVYLAYVMRKRSILSAYTIDDGTFIWKKKFRSSISADISVANDSLAILTDKGRLYVIGAKDE